MFSNFFSFYGLGFRVRVTVSVRVLGLGFSVRVRVRVNVTGSGSYLNEIFCNYLLLVLPSGECARKIRRTENSKFRPVAVSSPK